MNLLRTFLVLLLPFTTLANTLPSIFDELSYEEVLSVDITLDKNALAANIRSEEKHPGILSYKDADGTLQNWDIKIKLRGKFRRMRCTETPPLKLYFDKTTLKENGLAAYNDLKLVNFCASDKLEAKELLIKEYLAYKMYNELSDESFRVQLLKINYIDSVTGKKSKKWGFLIEDTAQVRARINAQKKSKGASLNQDQFNAAQVQTMALFQYMIGNTDWRLEMEKNVKIVVQNDELLAIPYDFDFSGLVNPSYGIPNGNFGLTSMTERVYLGFPNDISELQNSIDLFEMKKKALYTLVKRQKHLSWEGKESIYIYLNEFFDNLNTKTIIRAIPLAENAAEGLTK